MGEKEKEINNLVKWTQRKGKVRGFLGQETGQGNIPSDNGGDDAKSTTGDLGGSVGVEIRCSKQDESNSQAEEQ